MKGDKKEFHRQDYNSNSEDDVSSSSSEDDESAELLTEELEERFFKVLSQLRKKDSKLYEESVKFFPGNSSEGDGLSDVNTGKTKKKSQKEYREWLKGQKDKVENKEIKEELDALHEFWSSPTLNKDEQFLRDYILNKKFLEPDDSFNIEEEMNKLSDEEREVEEQIRFEHKYNCRFENPDQELPVINKNKSKPKRKNNKAGKELLLHANDDSLHNDILPNGPIEKVEINQEETIIEKTKKKKKKARNKENKRFEATKEDNKIESFTKEEEVEKKNLKGAKHINSDNGEDMSQANTNTKKYENGKSRKRKRNNSEKNNEEKSTLNISSNVDTNQSVTLHPKKKRKRNVHKIETSGTKKMRGNVKIVLPENQQKQMNNLPRNQKMKNKKGITKLRHRNRKKALWIKANNGVAEPDGKIKDQAVGLKIGKKGEYYNRHNKFDSGAKKKEKVQTKKNTHFQNLVVKEKKDKKLKFGKFLSKKYKSANAVVGKR